MKRWGLWLGLDFMHSRGNRGETISKIDKVNYWWQWYRNALCLFTYFNVSYLCQAMLLHVKKVHLWPTYLAQVWVKSCNIHQNLIAIIILFIVLSLAGWSFFMSSIIKVWRTLSEPERIVFCCCLSCTINFPRV